jgi:hypothetical protein
VVKNTKFKLFAALCACLLTFMAGCRIINTGNGSTEAQATHKLQGQIVYSDLSENMRAAADSANPAKGVFVWIEQLGRKSGQDCPEGEYIFENLAPGEYNIVAELVRPGRPPLRARSMLQSAIPYNQEGSVEEIIIVPANKVVTGLLYDSSGEPLPVGTVLSMWGEEFFVGPEPGQFTTPFLPHDATAADLMVTGLPNRPRVSFELPETSPDNDEIHNTAVELGLADSETLEPVSARVSLKKNTTAIASLLKDLQTKDRIDIAIEPVNLNTSDAGFQVEWLTSRGKFDPETPATTLTTVAWIAPETAGLATISVKVSATGRGFYKIDIPAMVESRSSEKSINAFSFAGLAQSVEGVIDEENASIKLLVPFKTDVTALAPTIVHSGKSISPAALAPQDFSKTVEYTVTAEDETTKTYLVTVEVAASTEAILLSVFDSSLNLGNEAGTTEEPVTATINAPHGTTAIAPADLIYSADAKASLYSDAGFSKNKDMPVSLKVGVNKAWIKIVAADQTTIKNYALTINLAAADDLSATITPAAGAAIGDTNLNIAGLTAGNVLWLNPEKDAGASAPAMNSSRDAGVYSLNISTSADHTFAGAGVSDIVEVNASNQIVAFGTVTIAATDIKAGASIANATVSGLKNNTLTTTDLAVSLQHDTFTAIAAGADVSAWVNNLPAGLTVAVKNPVTAGDNSIVCSISGTPTATAEAAFDIEIPAAVLELSSTSMAATANPAAKFVIVEVTASVADITIEGLKTVAINAQQISVTLTNDSFAAINQGTDLSGWFSVLPAGLSAKAKETVTAGATTLQIEITGIPATVSDEVISLDIPAADLQASGISVVSGVNANARFSLTAFAGGDGSEADPYQISNWYHLNNIRDELDQHFILISDLDNTTAGYAEHAGSAANSNLGWAPLGDDSDAENKFTGTFNGNDKVIANLYINRPAESNIGLFGRNDGEISNLTLSDIDVTADNSVGGIAGISYGNISGCHITSGTVTGNYAGGLVGYALYNTIDSCSSAATISATGAQVGGLVGSCAGATVSNSHATGAVTSAYTAAGGLIGFITNNSNINNCYATGAVSSTVYNARTGGLIGMAEASTISSSYATGAVSGTGQEVGGLIGFAGHSTSNTLINSCYATGNVSARGYVGGLVGFSNIDKTVISNSYAIGEVTAGSTGQAGGLVGLNQYAKIQNCYATGNLPGTSDYTGGLVGANSGTIQKCYSVGAVASTQTNTGGLIGFNSGPVAYCYWATDASTKATSAGGPVAIGKTSAQMTNEFTFSGWDFESQWGINESSSYPWLQSNKQEPAPAP